MFLWQGVHTKPKSARLTLSPRHRGTAYPDVWVSPPACKAVPPQLPLAPLFSRFSSLAAELTSPYRQDTWQKFLAAFITDTKPRIMKSMILARHESATGWRVMPTAAAEDAQCEFSELFRKHFGVMYTTYVWPCLRLWWPAGHQYGSRCQRVSKQPHNSITAWVRWSSSKIHSLIACVKF